MEKSKETFVSVAYGLIIGALLMATESVGYPIAAVAATWLIRNRPV